MPLYIATSQAVNGGPIYSLTTSDLLIVPSDVYLFQGSGSSTVYLLDRSRVHLSGQISALNGFGIFTGGTSSETEIIVNSTGQITAPTAIAMNGYTASVRNDGLLISTPMPNTGSLFVIQLRATYNSLINTGRIIQDFPSTQAVVFDSSNNIVENFGVITSRGGDVIAGSALVVRNSGQLMVLSTGFSTAFAVRAVAGVLSLVNTGTIDTPAFLGGRQYDPAGAVFSGTGAATIINSGQIIGDLILGAGVSRIENTGQIKGAIVALQDADLIVNDGLLTGSIDLGDGQNILTNRGRIAGPSVFGAGADLVFNEGTISGNVNLGAGADRLDSAYGVITGSIIGGLGDDIITGGTQRDVIYGDNVSGDSTGGADVLTGNAGDDLIFGGFGADQLYGNQGDDVLYGNQDNDWIHGGQGDDVLYGGQGNDTVNGGKGDDALYGNLGDDTFVFQAGFGHDVVGDFGNGAGDLIQFQPGTFVDFADVQAHATQLTGGVLLTDATGDTLYLVGATTGGLAASQFLFG